MNSAPAADAGFNWLARLVASAGFFCAGCVVAFAGALAGMFSPIFGTALLAWGATCLIASLVVWMHGALAAGRALVALGIVSAALSGLLGFTAGGEIAFGASALFVIATIGSVIVVRSGGFPGR